MVAWPSAFPKPEAGFSGELASPVDRVVMDSGEHRQRPVRRGRRRLYSVSFVLRDFRLAMFHAWFKYKLLDGVGGFTLTLPVDGVMAEKEAFFVTSQYQVSLLEPPSTWQVTAQIETYG